MGNYSRSTFDPLKHYASVRLQAGVPVVDADLNERGDLRRAEARAAVRGVAGSGVPRDSDGFRVSARNAADDFDLSAGLCWVDGWMVANDFDQRGDSAGATYRSQPLFANAALAAAWGVAPLPALTASGAPRTDRVYLDVWEREVDPAEDPSLVDPLLGVESALRLRREWVVRVAEGAAVPAPPAGHAFYELATLARSGNGPITAAQITDRRRTQLGLGSTVELRQIAGDAFGPEYAVDGRAGPRLKVSLREALNALLRGMLPTTPATLFVPAVGVSIATGNPAVTDRAGRTWVCWYTTAGTPAIWVRRWDTAAAQWSADTRLSTAVPESGTPIHAVEDLDGAIWVFWMADAGGTASTLRATRRDPATGQWSAEAALGAPADNMVLYDAVVDGGGDVWVVWRQASASGVVTLWYQRRARATGVWSAAARLTTANGDERPRAAVVAGDVWVFWNRGNDVWFRTFRRLLGTWSADAQVTTQGSRDENAAPVVDSTGSLWVFFETNRNAGAATDIYYTRWDDAGKFWHTQAPLAATGADEHAVTALAGEDGDVWLFGYSIQGSIAELWYRRYGRGGGWGPPITLYGDGYAYLPAAVADAAGDLLAFWSQVHGSDDYRLYFRKLFTSV